VRVAQEEEQVLEVTLRRENGVIYGVKRDSLLLEEVLSSFGILPKIQGDSF